MPDQRRPWPMKWIVIAIILIVVPYTFLTLHYRKPGRAFEPYQDMKNRANVARLLEAGYRRIALPAQRPADDAQPADRAVVSPAAGGIPADLRSTLIEPPRLPMEITRVIAAPVASTLRGYPIQFTCTLTDDKQHPGGVDLFLRGESVVMVPSFEALQGDLRARGSQSELLVTIPPGTLKPGNYAVTLAGQTASRTWKLEVK